MNATAAPPRSIEQREGALEHANAVRSARARVKRGLRAESVTLQDAFGEWSCQTATVHDLMLCLPKWGRVKVAKALCRIPISPSKTVESLSTRQRAAVLEVAGRREGLAA